MKAVNQFYWIFATVLLTASGCGVDFKVGNGGNAVQQSAESTDAALDVATDIEQILTLGGGVDAVAPDELSDLGALAAELGSFAAAPAIAGLVPAGAGDLCADGIPADGICRIVDTRRVGTDTLREETIDALLYFPTDAETPILIDARLTRSYTDGSTSNITLTDLTAPNGTTAADLGRHRSAWREVRVWPPDSRLQRRRSRLVLNLNGTLDTDAATRRERLGDAPDEFFAAAETSWFADGRVVRVKIFPDTPAQRGERPAAGAVTREVERPTGPLAGSSEHLSWDRRAERVDRQTLRTYADGTTEFARATLEAGSAREVEIGRRGTERIVTVSADGRSVSATTIFAAGAALERSDVQGSLTRADGIVTGELVRRETLRDGRQRRFEQTVTENRRQRTRTVSYIRRSPGNRVETGTIELARGRTEQRLTADITTNRQNRVQLEGDIATDRTTELQLRFDNLDTQASPDVTGTLTRFPDGTLRGEAMSDAGTFTIERDGRGELRTAAAGEIDTSTAPRQGDN